MIAVVDDDAALRRAIRRVLASAGYEVAEHSSGPAFLASLSEHHPHCVVLDLHMPDLDGFEVQDALRRSAYQIRVIVVTADHTPENVARAMSLGAAACLAKPVDDERLLDAVALQCGRKVA